MVAPVFHKIALLLIQQYCYIMAEKVNYKQVDKQIHQTDTTGIYKYSETDCQVLLEDLDTDTL